MAKMSEGKYYYYLPFKYSQTSFSICRRDAPHPNYTVIVEQVTQDNASLIVDALNLKAQMDESIRLKSDGKT